MSLYERGFGGESDQATNGTNGNSEFNPDVNPDTKMNEATDMNEDLNRNPENQNETQYSNTYTSNPGNTYGTAGNPNGNPMGNTGNPTANANNSAGMYGQNPYTAYGNPYANSFQNNGKASRRARRLEKRRLKAEKRQARGKMPQSFGKKLGTAVALALAFGLVSGVTFGGTQYLTSRMAGEKGGSSKTSATLTTGNSKGKLGATSTSSATTVTDVSDIVENVMPAIVQVTNISVTEYQSIFGRYQSGEQESAGSGIIISQDADYIYIATNNHVVADTKSLTVTFNDNSAVEGEVQGTDETTDLAVIKVKVSDLDKSTLSAIKVATIGSSDDLSVGESAVVIGNALGYGTSVTTGIISAKDREVSLQDENGNYITNKLIQTDAAVNPGNSGGALLNMNGEVVGIVSAKYSDTKVEGMGYAIPMSTASSIIERLMQGENITNDGDSASAKGYVEKTAKVTLDSDTTLKIYCVDVTSSMSEQYGIPVGVYVNSVITGGPAAKAGIQQYDVITKVDGEDASTTQKLKAILATKSAGDQITVTYQRPNSRNL